MYMKFDYFYGSTVDFEVKASEILKDVLPFSREKHGQVQGINYLVFGKY